MNALVRRGDALPPRPRRQPAELAHIFLRLFLRIVERQYRDAKDTRDDVVQLARDIGMSWRAIGEVMGRSPQSTQKHFQHLEPPDLDVSAALEQTDQGQLVVFDDEGEALTYNDLRAMRRPDASGNGEVS